MKYLAAISLVSCVGMAVSAAGIMDYGSVEFGLLKKMAVSGWLIAALFSLNGLLREAMKNKEAGE